MTLTIVSGDPLLTKADYLAFGHNAAGRTELGPVETTLLQHYPAPFASYVRQCKQNRIQTGTIWTWTESRPKLIFMVVRASSVGATRLRYVEAALMTIAREHHLHQIKSLALWRVGQDYEWPEIEPIVQHWLGKVSFSVVVYQEYRPGLRADENIP